MAMQRIGNVLHGKGVGASAGTHPQDINAGIEGSTDMLDRRHLGSDSHSRFALDSLQPRQAAVTDALKTARQGAGLPEAGPEHRHTDSAQRPCGIKRLLFGLGAAWPGDDDGGTIIHSWEPYGLYIL